jgi:hypothetical protein
MQCPKSEIPLFPSASQPGRMFCSKCSGTNGRPGASEGIGANTCELWMRFMGGPLLWRKHRSVRPVEVNPRSRYIVDSAGTCIGSWHMQAQRPRGNPGADAPTPTFIGMDMASFNEDMIVRVDLPRDVFELLHDLAYDHQGRERFQYRARAQKILKTRGASVQPGRECSCPLR